MNRRKYLGKTIAGLSALVLSGCLSNIPIGAYGAAELGDIIVINYDYKPHNIHVLVKRGDELVHWSSHHLKAENYARLKNTWGDGDVRYTVFMRRDAKNNWKKTDLSHLPDGTTFDLDIGVQTDGRITVAWSPEQ